MFKRYGEDKLRGGREKERRKVKKEIEPLLQLYVAVEFDRRPSRDTSEVTASEV